MTIFQFNDELSVATDVGDLFNAISKFTEELQSGKLHFSTPLVGCVLYKKQAQQLSKDWLVFPAIRNTAHHPGRVLSACFYEEKSPISRTELETQLNLFGKLNHLWVGLAPERQFPYSFVNGPKGIRGAIRSFSGCGSIYVQDSKVFLSEIAYITGYRGSLFIIKGEEFSEPKDQREERLLSYTLEHRRRIFESDYFYLPIPTVPLQITLLGPKPYIHY